MSSSEKLILCLAVLFCLLQAIVARPRFDGNFVENVRSELLNKCAGLEADLNKEVLNANVKLIKESGKLIKKAVKKEGSLDCIQVARSEAETLLQEKSEGMQNCVQALRESLEASLKPESTLPEVVAFRSNFKNELQFCKNSGKLGVKEVQNRFSVAGKKCLI